jgi:ABC-type polysaccharide/polyol phosphate transport system ATPase subunit
VSLSLGEGDAVGLVGHNGAGKTTMLRTAAGIFQPTSGTVTRNGTVATIIDLGAGMDSELSGSDNIIRMALLRGFSRVEINDKINEIIEFSELGNFIELPVKAYSSGMLMRLMFSTITVLPADILLIDEMFSTGDAEFQIKAELRIEKMIGDAKIFIFASHSQALIDRFCNQKFRLDHGSLVQI